MAFGIDDILGAGLQIINKVIPDPTAKAQAEIELFKLKQAGDFKELDAQIQMATAQASINQAEAANPSVLVSGWRPGAGWVCVVALFSEFIVRPYAAMLGYAVPSIGDQLFELLLGMLGLGGLRTLEKVKNVARS